MAFLFRCPPRPCPPIVLWIVAALQYIEVLRRCGGLKSRLHDARQAMRAAFPLTPALWMEWVADEVAGLGSGGGQDVAGVEALLEAAVQDYLSVPLWVQYLE